MHEHSYVVRGTERENRTHHRGLVCCRSPLHAAITPQHPMTRTLLLHGMRAESGARLEGRALRCTSSFYVRRPY